MIIEVNDLTKVVEIWLSNREKDDLLLRESLKPTFAKYAKKKYTVAVFESGACDLLGGTRDLLLQNRGTLM